MLSPASAYLQSALMPLVIFVAVALVAAFIWMGLPGKGSRSGKAASGARTGDRAEAGSPDAGHRGRRGQVDTDTDTDDSDFAPADPVQAPPRAYPGAVEQRTRLPLAADLLLVDDSAVARAKLRRLFESAGYQVQLARDGAEALELLQKGRYHLMVTDLEMPRLDGVELICACQGQAHTAAMPILAITGHDDLQARLNECQEICGIYRKPWIDEDLAHHVSQLVARPHSRRVDLQQA